MTFLADLYELGLSCPEISQHVHLPVSTVRAHLLRAGVKMRSFREAHAAAYARGRRQTGRPKGAATQNLIPRRLLAAYRAKAHYCAEGMLFLAVIAQAIADVGTPHQDLAFFSDGRLENLCHLIGLPFDQTWSEAVEPAIQERLAKRAA